VSVDGCIEAFKRLILVAYPAADETGTPREFSRISLPGSSSPPEAATQKSDGKASPHRATVDLDDALVPVPALLAEVGIELADPPLRGTLDLISTHLDGDVLIEFKTGTAKPEHEQQARFYGALWWAKTGRCLRERHLVYVRSGARQLPALDPTELAMELESLRARVTAAQRALEQRPPPARPDATRCQFCPVRQLCDEYWRSGATAENRWHIRDLTAPNETLNGQWHDLHLDLVGAESMGDGFSVRLGESDTTTDPDQPLVRLTCSVPLRFQNPQWKASSFARLLNVGLKRTGVALRVIWSRHSELFWG
jgi:CRISPR/Cas system-associated exonuclease Cas4 (RecB family)